MGLIGASGTGKTTYINRMLTKRFKTNHIPTLGMDLHSLVFYTNKGKIIFNVWDCDGKEEFMGYETDIYYIRSDAAIVFVDSLQSLQKAKRFVTKFRRVCESSHIYIVLHKVDEEDIANIYSTKQFKDILNSINMTAAVIKVSSKSNFNIEEPWLLIARNMLGGDTIFVNPLRRL